MLQILSGEGLVMRTAHAVLIFAAAALPATSAFAQAATPAPAQDMTGIVVKGQKEKKVCRTFEAPTGSRVGERRVCRTQAEWRLAEDAALRNMDKMNLHIEADQAQTLNEKGMGDRHLPH
jgi:hypothetical protein